MLKGMRKNTKGIIWTVIISFILWGGFSIGTQFDKKGRVAGEIFGRTVTFQEYTRFYKSQMLFTFGGSEGPKETEMLKKQTWESLIFSREAKQQKIEVKDDEVRAEILRLLALQKIENPTPEVYKRWLQSAVRETPQEFEAQVRELLRIQKLVQKVQADAKAKPATEEEAREAYINEQSQISAETITFKTEADAKKFLETVKTTEGWQKEAEKQKLTVYPSGFITLSAWVQLQGMPLTEASKLLSAEKGAILGPFAQGQDFILLKVVDKKAADEAEFQKTFKEKYIEQLNNMRNYEGFVIWQQGLLARAKLKDYLPKPPASSEASPAPAQKPQAAPAP